MQHRRNYSSPLLDMRKQECYLDNLMDGLNQFIDTCLDSREIKRALAVKMTLQGFTHSEIMTLLQVSSGFITK